MKRIFSKCVLIILILCIILYGFYLYWINTEHNGSSQNLKTSHARNIENMEIENSTYIEYKLEEGSNNQSKTNQPEDSTTTYNRTKVSQTSFNQTSGNQTKVSQTSFNQPTDNQTKVSQTSFNQPTDNQTSGNQTKVSQTSNNKTTVNRTSEIKSNNNTEKNTQKQESSSPNENSTIDNKNTINLGLYARSALLMDASNDRVLYEKNGLKEMPMASTTKIMTLIVALENSDLNDTVTVSKYASTMPDVQLGIREGEKYRLGDLVYSLMLESHNDTAVAIAEHVGGSVEGFAAMMNKKAKELGCKHTNFVTPNGLDADKHYTTAVDLARIASYAIKNQNFIKITNTTSYSFSEINGKRTFTVSNKDAFLHLMEGAIGVKTGFTGNAGYCFVGALERDNKTFISVVLACGWPPNKSYKWHDTKILMNYGLKNYSLYQIAGDKNKLKPIPVVNGQKNQVKIKAVEKNIELLLRDDETTRVEYCYPDVLVAPVNKKEIVGSVKYYINDELYDEAPIYTTSSVKKIDYRYCIDKIFKIWGLNF